MATEPKYAAIPTTTATTSDASCEASSMAAWTAMTAAAMAMPLIAGWMRACRTSPAVADANLRPMTTPVPDVTIDVMATTADAPTMPHSSIAYGNVAIIMTNLAPPNIGGTFGRPWLTNNGLIVPPRPFESPATDSHCKGSMIGIQVSPRTAGTRSGATRIVPKAIGKPRNATKWRLPM